MRAAVFLDLVTAAELSARVGESSLEHAGVDPYAFLVLAFIAEEEPVSSTRLARRSGIGRTTLRHAVDRLEERGDVERVPNEDDGRSQLIRITPSGRRRLRKGMAALERAGEQVEEQLGEPLERYLARVDELQRALRALVAEPVKEAR